MWSPESAERLVRWQSRPFETDITRRVERRFSSTNKPKKKPMKHHARFARRAHMDARIAAGLFAGCIALLAGHDAAAKPPAAAPGVQLTVVGSYASGIFNAGGSEIAAHDPLTQRLYVVNAQEASVNVLDISN